MNPRICSRLFSTQSRKRKTLFVHLIFVYLGCSVSVFARRTSRRFAEITRHGCWLPRNITLGRSFDSRLSICGVTFKTTSLHVNNSQLPRLYPSTSAIQADFKENRMYRGSRYVLFMGVQRIFKENTHALDTRPSAYLSMYIYTTQAEANLFSFDGKK